MTREEILAMEPGIEMDKLVSVRIMGFEIRREYEKEGYHEYYYREQYQFENVNYPDEWQPSRFISAAWEVVNKLIEMGMEINIGFYERWDCAIDYRGTQYDEWAETAPDAICKAALLAVLDL